MGYSHTQYGKLHYLFYAVAVLFFAAAWLAREEQFPPFLMLGIGLLVILFCFFFMTMTVRDEGACLTIRYGPLPLIRKRLPYVEMTAVQEGRSSFIDGWGIHYIPRRGWTYNLWGFSCVVITRVGNRTIRIGSDDAKNLASFLEAKL